MVFEALFLSKNYHDLRYKIAKTTKIFLVNKRKVLILQTIFWAKRKNYNVCVKIYAGVT
jgi:hypothetical protein